MYHEFEGPYFSDDLIGANGKLSRLHKGEKPKDPPPPAPIPTIADTAGATDQLLADQRKKRGGFLSTTFAGETGTGTTNTGGKSFLGQ